MSVGAWRIFMVDPPYERGIVEIAPRDICMGDCKRENDAWIGMWEEERAQQLRFIKQEELK